MVDGRPPACKPLVGAGDYRHGSARRCATQNRTGGPDSGPDYVYKRLSDIARHGECGDQLPGVNSDRY